MHATIHALIYRNEFFGDCRCVHACPICIQEGKQIHMYALMPIHFHNERVTVCCWHSHIIEAYVRIFKMFCTKWAFSSLKVQRSSTNTHISYPPMMSVNVYIIPNISFPCEALNFTLTDTHGENCLGFLSFKSEKWHMSNHYPQTFNALKLAHG